MLGMILGAALLRVRAAQLAGGTICWPLYAPVVVFLLIRLLVFLKNGEKVRVRNKRTDQFKYFELSMAV